MKDYKGQINSIENIAKDVVKITILSALNDCCPGQFISILCPNKIIRRPFSIADFNEKEKTITIFVKYKGEGTKYLQNLNVGDYINFIAPLGHGFKIENKKSLLIGAGIGIAPLLFLKKELDKNNIKNYLISGFKANDEVIKGSDETKIGGSVLDDIEKIIEDKKIELIYSCGPNTVLEKLSKIAKKNNIKTQVALEKVMACSMGVCKGCAIRLFRNNEIINKTVCHDGPVFDACEVMW